MYGKILFAVFGIALQYVDNLFRSGHRFRSYVFSAEKYKEQMMRESTNILSDNDSTAAFDCEGLSFEQEIDLSGYRRNPDASGGKCSS